MALITDPDAILNCDDDEYEVVNVPKWGGEIRVRSITAAERERLLKTSVVIDPKTGERTVSTPLMRVEIVYLAVVDEAGNRVFKNPKQVELLGHKAAKSLDLVADAAMRLAGIGDDGAGAGGKDGSSAPTNATASD